MPGKKTIIFPARTRNRWNDRDTTIKILMERLNVLLRRLVHFYCKYLRGLWRNISCHARLAQSSDFREFIWVAHLLSCLAFKTLVCITISHIQEERSSSSYKHLRKLLARAASLHFGKKLWEIPKVSHHSFTHTAVCWNQICCHFIQQQSAITFIFLHQGSRFRFF